MKTLFFTLSMLLAVVAMQAQVNTKAPDFNVNLLGGGSYSLSDDVGKVVLIFFFGYGCPSCLAVAPKVRDDLFNAYASNADFSYISIDAWNGNNTQVSQFVSQRSIPGKVGVMGQSVASSLGSSYDRLVVIDKQGFIRHHTDNLASSDVETVKSVLNSYLANNPTNLDNDVLSTLTNVYPNPVSDVLTIDFAEQQTGTILLLDVAGKQVYNEFFSSATITIDAGSFNKGMYILHIETNDGTLNKRIIVN